MNIGCKNIKHLLRSRNPERADSIAKEKSAKKKDNIKVKKENATSNTQKDRKKSHEKGQCGTCRQEQEAENTRKEKL